MVRYIYLTDADYAQLVRWESREWGCPVSPCSYEGMPIINAAGLAKLGLAVPEQSTVYEIEAAHG